MCNSNERCKLTTKVVTLVVRLYHSLLPILALDRNSGTRLDEVKLVSCVTLLDDVGAFGESARLEDVGNLGAFLRLERGEDGNFGEEGFIQAALAGSVLYISIQALRMARQRV